MAGVFALLYGMFMVGTGFAESVKEGMNVSNAKRVAKVNDSLVYYIGSQEYFLANDIPCRTTYLENGHKVIMGTGKYNGYILHDYDKGLEKKLEFEFEKDLAWAKCKGMKYLSLNKYFKENISTEKGIGLYLEIDTNRKFTLKTIKIGKERSYIVYYLNDNFEYEPKLYGGGSDLRKVYKCQRDSEGKEI